jgi:hypothetical protein
MTHRLDEIKERWSLDSSLPRPVPWGLDDAHFGVDIPAASRGAGMGSYHRRHNNVLPRAAGRQQQRR